MDVINIEEGKGKGKSKKKSKGKEDGANDKQPRIVDTYANISDIIEGKHELLGLPAFHRRYGVLSPEEGVRLPVLVSDDDTVAIVKRESLINDIVRYGADHEARAPEYLLKVSHAKEAADLYLARAQPIEAKEVALVRWRSEGGLAYTRLPWELQLGDTPTWDELMGRMSNAMAFCHWIGSLLDENSSLQNFVWLFGGGGEGKGSINRFLAKVFGRGYRSKQPPSGSFPDKFWSYGVLGARLVVFPDCDDHKFVGRGLFKSLTGGDPIDVEAKGQMSFTANLNAKYLVISNERPTLSGSRADMRRVIYCEIGKAGSYDPLFEERLWAEGGAFLSTCLLAYRATHPEHGPISAETEEIEDIVSSHEEDYEVVFDKWFIADPTAMEEEALKTEEMIKILNQEWPHRQKQREGFKNWMERVHMIKRQTVGVGKKRNQKRYVRVRVNDAAKRDYENRIADLMISRLPPD